MAWSKLFFPKKSSVSIGEKFVSALASLFAIFLTLSVSQVFLEPKELPLIVASMGASCVLLFAIPQGPLSQPWPFVFGHLVSAFVGITVALLVDDLLWASCLAVSLAIFFMYITSSLHPPGGATALTVVIGGESIYELGYLFMLTPLAINLLVILVWALIINNYLPNRSYPNGIRELFFNPDKNTHNNQEKKLNISREDLHEALEDLDVFVDVSENELDKIFRLSIAHIQRKKMGEIYCQDVMSYPVISVEYGTEIEEIWALMEKYHIHGVPVVDKLNRVVGMVTIADFLNQLKNSDQKSLAQRFNSFIQRTPDVSTDKLEFAGHIMSKPPICIRDKQHVQEVFKLFENNGPRHIPVVDEKQHLLGIITPNDLLAVLYSDQNTL